MKTLALPLCLLLLVTACRKAEMPEPMNSKSSTSSARVIGDTLEHIVEYPLGEHKPLTNHIGPRNLRPNQSTSTFRVSGDTLIRATNTPGLHKPLINSTGPLRPR